jgi:hypothetical protein
MRSVIAFYRARPLVGVVMFVLALAIGATTALLQDGGGIVLPIAMCALLGLIAGLVLAAGQNRDAPDDTTAALDPTDPRDLGR